MARKKLAHRSCEFRLPVFQMGKLRSQKDLAQTCGFGGMTDSQASPTRSALSTPHVASSLLKILLGASWIDAGSGRQCSWCNLSNYIGDDSGILSNPSLGLRVEFIFYSSDNQDHGISAMTAVPRQSILWVKKKARITKRPIRALGETINTQLLCK